VVGLSAVAGNLAATTVAVATSAVAVAAWCGLRFGELIELRRKDVHNDGDRMTLRIRRAATIVDNKLVVGPPKTDAGIRDVTVPPHVAEILRAHMKARTRRGPEAFVFHHETRSTIIQNGVHQDGQGGVRQRRQARHAGP